MSRSLPLLLPLLLLLFLLLTVLLALKLGSSHLEWVTLWQILLGEEQGVRATVVLELRLPRIVAAFVVGGLLALAGLLMQVLLRNPLADPYVLGVSGGAAVAALLILLLGASSVWMAPAAFVGALLSMLLVFGLARLRGSWEPMRLLLTGVVVAAGWGSIITFLLAVSPDQTLRSMVFWLMGDLGQPTLPLWELLLLLLGSVLAYLMAREINVLARGGEQAAAFGVSVERLRLVLFLLASLLTATAVTLAGSVGFIGLVVPHMIRLMGGGDHRLLVPASVLLGGGLLILSDTLARTLLAPQQLPVGVVTAMLGVPLFLYLLQRSGR
ncbi:MAG: iron ABC transporter permease [Gammaproteobacteria bacterium]|nr:iron ABC transporter permease [Gammaproteobacteria bacterium]